MTEMRLFDLRVTVERIEGRSVCGLEVGDYFEVTQSSRVRIPDGRHFCLFAIQATAGLPRVAVIALAKREEEVFVPARPNPIILDRHDPGLQLLQHIRDEAHRFAVTFHRQKRDTRAFSSIFDTLDGIGPSRRRSILHHFGSAERFLAASQEELEAVPGLPAKTARSVYGQLHRTGGPAS